MNWIRRSVDIDREEWGMILITITIILIFIVVWVGTGE